MYGRRVHQAVLASGDTTSGATVHLVSRSTTRARFSARERAGAPGDTPETLAARVLEVEHRCFRPRCWQSAAGGTTDSVRLEGESMKVPGPQSPSTRP